jgi:type II secretory ATPase GspE/PulE/Tfp pilus assembly ATPase PilB-like protein
VDLVVRQAIDERASDIHIEPFKEKISLRYRIDGKLYEIPPPAKHLHLPIVSRIKILAKLDIAERRRPQDGSFRVRVDRGGEAVSIDLRMSVVPSYYGESVVLRLLDRSRAPRSIEDLGFSRVVTEKLHQCLKRPAGILLITLRESLPDFFWTISNGMIIGGTILLYMGLERFTGNRSRQVHNNDPITGGIEDCSQFLFRFP